MIKVSEIISYINEIAPTDQAVKDDPIGLHVGDISSDVSCIGVALDASHTTVNNAINNDVNMLITHHPLIFNPLKSLVAGDAVSERVINLVKHNIALYCAHTNFDRAEDGTNDSLAQALELTGVEHIIEVNDHNLCKVVVFVPKENAYALANALGDVGAGSIGLYSHCSFHTEGTGYFKPLSGSNPTIGTTNNLESVGEIRLEMVCPEHILSDIICTISKVHPYETPAYDIYPLHNKLPYQGIGRIGNLEYSISFPEFARYVDKKLRCNGMRVYGKISKPIKRVALCAGGGAKYYKEAFFKGADVFVTGDVTYHTIVDAQPLDMGIIDAGHRETEIPGVISLHKKIQEKFAGFGIQTIYLE